MTSVVALDLALRSTGVAVWRDGLVAVHTIRTDPIGHNLNGWAMAMRRERILARLAGLFAHLREEPGQLLVLKEERIQSLEVAGNSALDLAAVHAVVEQALYGRRIPIVDVNLMQLKVFATGSGSATKDDMLINAQRVFPRPLIANDHEADARWLLAMAQCRYNLAGAPSRTSRQLSKIQAVDWPSWLPTSRGGNE